MRSENIAYLPPIDVLRGVAALWIVFYHGYKLIGVHLEQHYVEATGLWHVINTWLKIGLSQGHTSVALFMTLSGFIFTWGAYGKSISYLSFIRNRLLRIYPLYVLMLLLGLAAFPTAFSLERIICMLLPLADFRDLDLPGLTTMSWAIAVEFQFYLIFPLLITILNRSHAPCTQLFKWVMIINLLRIFACLIGGNPDQLVYWHLMGRLDQFLFGMLAAIWLKQHHQYQKYAHIGLIAGLLLLTTLLYQFNIIDQKPNNIYTKMVLPGIEGGIWALIIASMVGTQETLANAYNLFKKAFVWIGQRSFSVYLLHFPLLLLIRKFNLFFHTITVSPAADLLMNLILIVLPPLLLVSHLTFTHIEKPFLALRKAYVQ